MTPPPVSEYRLRRRIQFHEVDAAGIVHFSWFFKYMEEAEHALWRAAGLSIALPGAELAFPRVAASFEYHQPLRFDDECVVHIRISAMGDRSLRYACVIWRDETRIATGAMTVVCVTLRKGAPMKAVSIPEDVSSHFAVAATLEGQQ